MNNYSSLASITGGPSRTPKTIDELRHRFGLTADSDAEALLNAWPIKEAFYAYLNRCLSTQRTRPLELPGWKEVDQYLVEIQARHRSKPLGQLLEKKCMGFPFELMPHVALFVLRAEVFLQSDEGSAFDGAGVKYGAKQDREFDRRWRCTDLLCFSVHRHHIM